MHSIRNMHFKIPWKALYLHITICAFYYIFPKCTFYTLSCKCPKVVFNLLLTIFFWLASLASIIQTYYIYTYIVLLSSILSMEWSSFLYIPLIQIIIMKRIQLPIPCIHERAFSYFSCPELHDFTPFKTKNFWGRTPSLPPSSTHLQYKTTMSSIFFCRVSLSFVQKTMPYWK